MPSLAWSTSAGQPPRTRSSWVCPDQSCAAPKRTRGGLDSTILTPAPAEQAHDVCAGYRKACLEHHPDKAGAAIADDKTKAAIEDKFKVIQEAYDTLSDPQRRREYDSVDDFDDSLPFDCAAADFFKASLPCSLCPGDGPDQQRLAGYAETRPHC